MNKVIWSAASTGQVLGLGLGLGLGLVSPSHAAVEDRDGVYVLSCDDTEMFVQILAGQGSVAESGDSILLNSELQAEQIYLPVSCNADTGSAVDAATVTAAVQQFCETNLLLPSQWSTDCASLGANAANWAGDIQGALAQPAPEQFDIALRLNNIAFLRWLGLRPTEVDLTRADGSVSHYNTTTFGSGEFNLVSTVRYPIVAGLAGYQCVGGLVDDTDGKVEEQTDGALYGYIDERNTAGIVCTQDQGEDRVAVSLSVHLKTFYSGPAL